MKAKQILDKHINKMISEHPDEYYTLDEMKSQPEYQVFIDAMIEYAKTNCDCTEEETTGSMTEEVCNNCGRVQK